MSCSVTSLPERELGSLAIAGIPFMLGLGPVKADGWPRPSMKGISAVGSCVELVQVFIGINC